MHTSSITKKPHLLLLHHVSRPESRVPELPLRPLYGWNMLLQSVDNGITLPRFLLAMTLIAVVYTLYFRSSDGLSHIPPIHWSAKWAPWDLLWTKYVGSTKLRYYAAHLDHNGKGGFRPLVRVAPHHVSIMTSEGIRVVWGANLERSSWYEVFSNFGCVFALDLLYFTSSS